jgi:hypothetical protein
MKYTPYQQARKNILQYLLIYTTSKIKLNLNLSLGFIL